jgi:hypothetical protein
MTEATREPFNREESLNEPGIIGARWWQRSLDVPVDPAGRRAALITMLAAGGVLAGMGVLIASVGSGPSGDDYRTESRAALEMQKEYGWSFGAITESLTFDGVAQKPFDRTRLPYLPDDLRPSLGRYAAFFTPTLFQSPAALPRSTPTGDAGALTPLKEALRPVSTPAMDRAYGRGRALAALWKGQAPAAAVIVDLPGPEAVAFAAGAAGVLDPVFLFDNWPHPRGVVPAHLTLGAAAYYQPLFARKKAPAGAAPLFVLDRARLATYTDDASQFDNRHVARLPGAAQMKQLGFSHVLYVAPTSADRLELDDLNDDFMLYAAGGLTVRMAAADAFGIDPADTALAPPGDEEATLARYHYGGRVASDLYFWTDYPWVQLPAPRPAPPRAPRPGSTPPRGPDAPLEPPFARPGKDYVPRPRITPFSTGTPASSGRSRPAGFGTVPVVVAVATGLILGAKLSRSGSWNRSGSWGGGG